MLITGAGGQLGVALAEEFSEATALTRLDWDVTFPPPAGLAPEVVLHAAAWTDVDGAEDDPQGAAAVNVGGTNHAASLGPIVYYSTDYVFDGRKRLPYVESDASSERNACHGAFAPTAARPQLRIRDFCDRLARASRP